MVNETTSIPAKDGDAGDGGEESRPQPDAARTETIPDNLLRVIRHVIREGGD